MSNEESRVSARFFIRHSTFDIRHSIPRSRSPHVVALNDYPAVPRLLAAGVTALVCRGWKARATREIECRMSDEECRMKSRVFRHASSFDIRHSTFVIQSLDRAHRTLF